MLADGISFLFGVPLPAPCSGIKSAVGESRICRYTDSSRYCEPADLDDVSSGWILNARFPRDASLRSRHRGSVICYGRNERDRLSERHGNMIDRASVC